MLNVIFGEVKYFFAEMGNDEKFATQLREDGVKYNREVVTNDGIYVGSIFQIKCMSCYYNYYRMKFKLKEIEK